MMKENKFPPGWDEERIKRVLAHYEEQTEEEAVIEDELVLEDQNQAVMEIPLALVPVVRELLAQYYDDNKVPA
jgi:hypothetical protein